LPGITFAAWFWYGFMKTGISLMPLSAQSFFNSTGLAQVQSRMIRFALYGDLGIIDSLIQFKFLVAFGLVFLGLIAFLCIRAWKINVSLGVFACTFLLVEGFLAFALIQVFVSLPRFLSLIFPAGISLGTKKRGIMVAVFVTFIAFDIVAWWMFLFTNNFH